MSIKNVFISLCGMLCDNDIDLLPLATFIVTDDFLVCYQNIVIDHITLRNLDMMRQGAAYYMDLRNPRRVLWNVVPWYKAIHQRMNIPSTYSHCFLLGNSK